MTYELFLLRVMNRTGLAERTEAMELVHHVADRLGRCLRESAAERVAERLPPTVAARLQEDAGQGECDLQGLYLAVSEELSLELGFGVEFTQVVLQIIGECAGLAGRRTLCEELPEEWHVHFEPRQSYQRIRRAQRTDQQTLASGKPGSSRPLSQGRPGHRHSVALNDQAHQGDEISTSRGKAERRTLAGGKPGSSRPISDA